MKRLKEFILFCAVVAVLGLGTHFVKPQAVTPQQRTQHMVQFLNDTGDTERECTASSIGPHAILTAAHCNDGDKPLSNLYVDYSIVVYHIFAEADDGHDHVIYLLDGPAFKNYIPTEALIKSGPISATDHVSLYGCGQDTFPPRRLDGKLDVELQSADSSDVNAEQGLQYVTLPVIPGDSGAAIFGDDGRVFGLVTYKVGTDAALFPLAFTPDAYDVAKVFDPTKIQ